jgi:hypothetical protein
MLRMTFYLGALVSVVTAFEAAVAEDNRLHLDRAQGVINAFQVICTLEPLSFERIEQKATVMGMKLQRNESAPSAGNTVTRSKGWYGTLTNGPIRTFAGGDVWSTGKNHELRNRGGCSRSRRLSG